MPAIIAVYRKPDDPEAFDKHYRETHLPLARKMPGLRKVEVYTAGKSLIGSSDIYTIAIQHFDDMDSLNTAATSDEGMAAGKDAYKLAREKVHLFIAESVSE